MMSMAVRGSSSARDAEAQAQGTRTLPPTRPPTPPFQTLIFTPGPCRKCRDFFHSGALLIRERRWRSAGGHGFIADSWTACFEACHESIGGFRDGSFVTGMSWSRRSHSAMTSGFRGMARRTRSMVRRAVLRSAGRLPPCDRTAPQHPSRYGVTTLWAHFWPP